MEWSYICWFFEMMINDVTVQKGDKENSWIAQTSVTSLCGGNHIGDCDDDEYVYAHGVLYSLWWWYKSTDCSGRWWGCFWCMTLPPPAKRGQREYFGDEKLVFISGNSICHSIIRLMIMIIMLVIMIIIIVIMIMIVTIINSLYDYHRHSLS